MPKRDNREFSISALAEFIRQALIELKATSITPSQLIDYINKSCGCNVNGDDMQIIKICIKEAIIEEAINFDFENDKFTISNIIPDEICTGASADPDKTLRKRRRVNKRSSRSRRSRSSRMRRARNHRRCYSTARRRKERQIDKSETTKNCPTN